MADDTKDDEEAEVAAATEEAEDELDGDETAGDEDLELDPAKSKVGGKRKLIFIFAAALILAAAGGAAFFFLGGSPDAETGSESGEAAEVDGKPIYVTMPEFLVNLNSDSRDPSFIKMTVILEVSSEKDVDAIESYKPRIVDSFNTYLRELRSSDLAGSAGLYRLREELLLRLNQVIAPAKVNYINFENIVVQ